MDPRNFSKFIGKCFGSRYNDRYNLRFLMILDIEKSEKFSDLLNVTLLYPNGSTGTAHWNEFNFHHTDFF